MRCCKLISATIRPSQRLFGLVYLLAASVWALELQAETICNLIEFRCSPLLIKPLTTRVLPRNAGIFIRWRTRSWHSYLPGQQNICITFAGRRAGWESRRKQFVSLIINMAATFMYVPLCRQITDMPSTFALI